MKYEISDELVKSLLNYLAQRPFAEVHQAIATLQQLPKVQEAEKTKK